MKHKEKARIITDRDCAVNAMLETAEKMENCVVILAGCGSDAYVKRGTTFVEFATAYEQVVLRNQYLGVAPARADAAATISETDPTVGILFDRLDRGYISIMPAITEIGQLWTPAESFLIDLSTDPYREERGEALLFTTDAEIQAGLERLCTQIRDAIETLS